MSAQNLLTLAERYRVAREAYGAEMAKRPVLTADYATKEEVAARNAMNNAQLSLLLAAEDYKTDEDGPVLLPDLRLARGEKLMLEEALARTGSMRLAAQLLDVTIRRIRTLMLRHQIAWPKDPR